VRYGRKVEMEEPTRSEIMLFGFVKKNSEIVKWLSEREIIREWETGIAP
jgi:hypothetical protein